MQRPLQRRRRSRMAVVMGEEDGGVGVRSGGYIYHELWQVMFLRPWVTSFSSIFGFVFCFFFRRPCAARFVQCHLTLSRSQVLVEEDRVKYIASETSAMMRHYHSTQCRPISFPPCHWPSLDNGSCWLKGSSVLSAWMMDAAPVLSHPVWALQRGRQMSASRVETHVTADKDSRCYIPLLLFRKLTTGSLNYSQCWIMSLSMLIMSADLSEVCVMAE